MLQTAPIIVICTAILGMLFFWRALHNLFAEKFKRTRGAIQMMLALVCLTTASTLGLLAMSLSVYAPYAEDKLVATLTFEKVKIKQTYTAYLDWEDGLSQSYVVKGEQWELSARIIKWKGFAANVLRFDPVYQFDRFEGRYDDVEQEKFGDKTVYELSSDKTLKLYDLAKQYEERFPFVDAEYGSATYLPIDPTRTFEVYLSATGLYAKAR